MRTMTLSARAVGERRPIPKEACAIESSAKIANALSGKNLTAKMEWSESSLPPDYSGCRVVSGATLEEMSRFVSKRNGLFVLAMMLGVVGAGVAQSSPSANSASTSGRGWRVDANPERLVNGAPVFFHVTAPASLKSLTATWLGHSIVFDAGSSKSWFAIAGVSLETKAGRYPLALSGETSDGKKLKFEQTFAVATQKYPVVKLTVSKQFTAPSPEQQEVIKKDQELKRQVLSEISAEREWRGPFEAPVDAPISDVFGVRRVFNGVTKSVHQGLDFRVPPSTPVEAINKGKVILARPLYFEGNCVVIDHGQGLLTLYLHLSELKVKEGDLVNRGQEIGLSGATGRATGPHLHLAVRWQGTYLDPAALLRLPVPGA